MRAVLETLMGMVQPQQTNKTNKQTTIPNPSAQKHTAFLQADNPQKTTDIYRALLEIQVSST